MPTYVRRILLASINAAMMVALSAHAQPSPAPAAGAQAQGGQQGDHGQAREQQFRRLAVLAQRLNLTEGQKRQWLQIQRKAAQSVRAARRDDSLNEGQMQQKIKEIHAEQQRQLLGMLTPQQQDALKTWWEEQKQKQQEKKSEAAGSGASDDKPGASDDDFFAGMVQDDDPVAGPAQVRNQKKPGPPQN